MKTIYFDNNATTKVADEVFEEIKPFFCELYGNPSSMHTFGGQVGIKIRKAREKTAALLGATRRKLYLPAAAPKATTPQLRGHWPLTPINARS